MGALKRIAAFLLILVGLASMAACGGGGSGSNPNPPPAGPTITGITISPTSISLYADTTQQFTAVVTGTGDFNPDVTWTQTGGVSISSSGLFTAGATAGQETVIATSAADPSFFVSAAITVSYQTVSFGNWYGTLTADSGVLLLPLDFSLSRTGPSLVGPHAALVILPAGGALACPAIDLSTTTEAKIGTDLQGISSTAINTPGLITGSIDSQNVSLTYMPASNDEEQPITLTGTLSADGSTISGTFSKSATGCLGSVTSGNFSFSLYPSPSTAATPYSGFFSFGSQNGSFFTRSRKYNRGGLRRLFGGKLSDNRRTRRKVFSRLGSRFHGCRVDAACYLGDSERSFRRFIGCFHIRAIIRVRGPEHLFRTFV